MRVLIIRLGAFGDIVHTLPLAADLAAAGMTVDWLCEDRWAVLLKGSPAVNSIIELPRRRLRDAATPWRSRLGCLRQIVRRLRQTRYDAVIDAQGLAKSATFSAFSGALRRIGHARPRSREGAWLIAQDRVPPVAGHVIDQQRALGLPLLGGDHPRGGWSFPLPAWTDERTWAGEWLKSQGLNHPWVLNVGAGWPTKVWPLERQIGLAQALAAQHIPLLVAWGSKTEGAVARRVVADAGWGVCAPDTTIPQLAGLMAAARVVISGDTGPLHLALAVNTPAVGLFGPVPATRNGPRGIGYRCLQAPGAAWERKDVSKVDMGAISVDAVIAAAQAAMAERMR